MKTNIATLILALACLFAGHASALTLEDVAGIYEGTSTATLPSGAIITAQLTVKLKPGGKIKTTSTVNGTTSTAKGTFDFASDDVILGAFPSGEFVAFVDQSGSGLTFTLLAREPDGSIVSEKTVLTLVEKL